MSLLENSSEKQFTKESISNKNSHSPSSIFSLVVKIHLKTFNSSTLTSTETFSPWKIQVKTSQQCNRPSQSMIVYQMVRTNTSICSAHQNHPQTSKFSSQSTYPLTQLKQNGFHNELRRFQVQHTNSIKNKDVQKRVHQSHQTWMAHHVLQPRTQLHHLRIKSRFQCWINERKHCSQRLPWKGLNHHILLAGSQIDELWRQVSSPSLHNLMLKTSNLGLQRNETKAVHKPRQRPNPPSNSKHLHERLTSP